MSTKWEKLEGNQGVLTVEVDADKVKEAIDQAFKKVVKQVNIPGFRKGKVPRVIFNKHFGEESLYQDALDILLPEAYAKAVEESGIEPVDTPEVDIKQLEKGQNLIFTATVTVKPEVKLGEYTGLEVEEKDVTVTDEDVEAELKALQQRFAELVVKEDGEVEDGDTAMIDFEGFLNDEPFEGGKGENYPLVIGSGSFIPGFEEQLIGMKKDEEKDIQVTFPEEYHAEELAGKEVTFKVKINEIKAQELPELDDEFAKDANEEVETLEELKESVKKDLAQKKEADALDSKRNAVIEQAVNNSEVDLPEAMINTELDRMIPEFEQRLQMQGMNLELYYQLTASNEDALKEQMKEEAEMRVRTRLTLEAIANAENIEASDVDVEEEIGKIAEMYQTDVATVKNLYESQGYLESLRDDLKARKAIDLLVEKANVK
ncbi:trigger factor [Massilibacterium senegalense]|uniref:trigger factor n=1 Tax=Massilibacterium senegalense TaxID=1632858 RepID=UPI0007803AC5|nr:trigger factor [Massilibacterium senegalense]